MNVIITGASGFVGQNLSDYLAKQDFRIKKLSLREESYKNQFDSIADAVIHLAGKAHDTSNTSADIEYFKVNSELTAEIFEVFKNSQIRDFFYFSSVKAVADSVVGVLEENIVGNPLTPYGKSKLQAEEYLLSQKLPEGKRLFVIRPCMIHGPGNKGNLNLLYQIVERGLPWPLASFHNQRSFLSIGNLSFLIKSILENHSVTSGIYNFSDDEALSTNDLVSLIAGSLNKKSRLWHVSKYLIKGLVKIGDILPLPLNSERLKKLTESYVVSNKKIKSALHIDKLPLTAEQGLAITIKSFKQNT